MKGVGDEDDGVVTKAVAAATAAEGEVAFQTGEDD